MNKIFLSGNLTTDCEEKCTNSGLTYVKNSIAVKRTFSKENLTDFFSVTAFNKTAEFMATYLKKGSRVLLEGHLQTSTVDKDGEKKIYFDVIVDNIEFAGIKSHDENKSDTAPPPAKKSPVRKQKSFDDYDEAFPF